MYEDFLQNAARSIGEKHSFHEKLMEKLIPLKESSKFDLIKKINKVKINGIISGVDSGFVSKKLSFLDLVLIRTVGAIFTYENGVLQKADYHPAPFDFPKPFLLKTGLEKDEENQSVSLNRLKQEVQVSIDIIKKYKPSFAFVDGSIVPQYQDKPRTDSKITNEYVSIINLFESFYKTAKENNCTIISCVEDSRGTRFKQILQEEILPKTSIPSNVVEDSFDAALLDYFLLEGERTIAFSYTKKIESHAILKDLKKSYSEKINVFYLKASNNDKPLRVEFIADNNLEEEATKIANIVYTLSSIHKEYSYPSILIEADMRAGLNEQDIGVVYDRLVDSLGPKVRMRRNSRPFK